MNAQRNFDDSAQDSTQDSHPQQFGSFDEMLSEAESTFRKGLGSLNGWVEQFRDVFEGKPSAIMGAAGVVGLAAGILIRNSLAARKHGPVSGIKRDSLGLREIKTSSQPALDPVFLLAGGLAVGLTMGPKVVDQVLSMLSRVESGGSRNSTFDVDGTKLRSTGSMNAKPFEK